jgi:hypothetical protein
VIQTSATPPPTADTPANPNDNGRQQYWQVINPANSYAKGRWPNAVLGALDAAGVTP